jgi:hypothetical protein
MEGNKMAEKGFASRTATELFPSMAGFARLCTKVRCWSGEFAECRRGANLEMRFSAVRNADLLFNQQNE